MKKPRQESKKLVLGITGNFGSGKSTVARLFCRRNCLMIDADKICHRLITPGSKIYAKIIKAFGAEIISDEKSIDRKKLGQEVFSDKKKLVKLNKIIHPEAVKLIRQQIAAAKRGLVIVDAPLLIEAGLKNSMDKLVVVDIRKYSQLKRLLLKKNLSKEQILKRISLQMPLKEKARLADFIIDNNSTLKNTKNQVELIRRKLWTN